MKRVMWALVLLVSVSMAQAAMDLATVLGKVDENAKKLDNCMITVQSETVRATTAGTEPSGKGSAKMMLFGGMARNELETTTKRGDKESTTRSIQTWDGKQSLTLNIPLSAETATKTLYIRTNENKGTTYGALVPNTASWKSVKDASVVESPDGTLRVSNSQRLMVVDPKKGYAVEMTASSMRSPYMRGGVLNYVTLYKGYKQSPQGAWYPTEVVSFYPAKLDIATADAKMPVSTSTFMNTYKVTQADFNFKGSPKMATITPEEGWQVYDYTRGAGDMRAAALSYRFRKGLTEADLTKMSEQQKAEAAKRTEQLAARKKAMEETKASLLNNPHPDLASLEFFSGPVKSAKELEGKVVLLDYWATWCGWCTRSLPQIKEWNEKYKDQGLVVLGINSDKNDTPEKIKAFLEKEQTVHTIARDLNQQVHDAYAVGGIPQFYLIDRNGVVVHGLTGYGGPIPERNNPGDGFKTLEAKIQEALAAQPSGAYQTKSLEEKVKAQTSQAR